MRYWRVVDNVSNLEAHVIERPDRRLSARPGPFNANVKIFNPVILYDIPHFLRSNLGSEWSAFTRPAKPRCPRGRPGKRVTFTIRNGNYGVIERRANVNNPVGNISFNPFCGTTRCCHVDTLPRKPFFIFTCESAGAAPSGFSRWYGYADHEPEDLDDAAFRGSIPDPSAA